MCRSACGKGSLGSLCCVAITLGTAFPPPSLAFPGAAAGGRCHTYCFPAAGQCHTLHLPRRCRCGRPALHSCCLHSDASLQVLGQRKRASAFAVLDANGVFEELRSLLAMAEEGRRQWAQHAQRAQQP